MEEFNRWCSLKKCNRARTSVCKVLRAKNIFDDCASCAQDIRGGNGEVHGALDALKLVAINIAYIATWGRLVRYDGLKDYRSFEEWVLHCLAHDLFIESAGTGTAIMKTTQHCMSKQVIQEIEKGLIQVCILLLLDTKLLYPLIRVMIPMCERAAGF